MKSCLNGAVAVLALALSCSPILVAQGDPQDPPADRQGGRDGYGPRSQAWNNGQGGERGQWGRRQGGFGRDGHGGRHGFGRGQRGFRLVRLLKDPAIRQELGITAEQAAKIRQQDSDFRKERIRGRADLAVKRIDLQNLLAADKPDQAAIDSKLTEISAAQLVLEKSAVHYRLAMRDVITPAQREKLRQLIKDRRSPGDGPGRQGPPGAGRRGPRGPAPAANAPARPQPNS
jgi:Spy/CpxP family protein refolding chaperone